MLVHVFTALTDRRNTHSTGWNSGQDGRGIGRLCQDQWHRSHHKGEETVEEPHFDGPVRQGQRQAKWDRFQAVVRMEGMLVIYIPKTSDGFFRHSKAHYMQ